jgi:hypothetical protein
MDKKARVEGSSSSSSCSHAAVVATHRSSNSSNSSSTTTTTPETASAAASYSSSTTPETASAAESYSSSSTPIEQWHAMSSKAIEGTTSIDDLHSIVDATRSRVRQLSPANRKGAPLPLPRIAAGGGCSVVVSETCDLLTFGKHGEVKNQAPTIVSDLEGKRAAGAEP